MMFYPKIQIKEKIGEGLNAIVYRAEINDRSLNINKTVAYKVLRRKEDLNHFKKELSNLIKASGKRLVKFYGWQKFKGKPGLILELVNGATLKELSSAFDLSISEKKWILAEVLKGLVELKECGLYHGDLSPKNIMIDVFGQIKLIDFGMTKWRTKLIEATPGFVSPALMNGESPSFKTDLDSFESLKSYLQLKAAEDIESFDHKAVALNLGDKVFSLSKDSETIEILASNQTAYLFNQKSVLYKPLGLKRLRTVFSLSLFCLMPYNLSFAVKDMGFLIRSKKWLAVKKLGAQSWCYTPCKLTFETGGPKQIAFKSSETSGVRTLNLDEAGFKEVGESDFY